MRQEPSRDPQRHPPGPASQPPEHGDVVVDLRRQIDLLKSELMTKSGEVSNLRSNLQKEKNAVIELKMKMKNGGDQVHGATLGPFQTNPRSSSQVARAVEDLKQQLAFKAQEIDDAKRYINDHQADLDHTKEELKKLTREHEVTKAEADEAKRRNQQMQLELEEQRRAFQKESGREEGGGPRKTPASVAVDGQQNNVMQGGHPVDSRARVRRDLDLLSSRHRDSRVRQQVIAVCGEELALLCADSDPQQHAGSHAGSGEVARDRGLRPGENRTQRQDIDSFASAFLAGTVGSQQLFLALVYHANGVARRDSVSQTLFPVLICMKSLLQCDSRCCAMVLDGELSSDTFQARPVDCPRVSVCLESSPSRKRKGGDGTENSHYDVGEGSDLVRRALNLHMGISVRWDSDAQERISGAARQWPTATLAAGSGILGACAWCLSRADFDTRIHEVAMACLLVLCFSAKPGSAIHAHWLKRLADTRVVANYLHSVGSPILQQHAVAILEHTLFAPSLMEYVESGHVLRMRTEKGPDGGTLSENSNLEACRFQWIFASGLVASLQSDHAETVLSSLRSLKRLAQFTGGASYLHRLHTYLIDELKTLSAAAGSMSSSACSSSLKISASSDSTVLQRMLTIARSMSMEKASTSGSPKSILIHLASLISRRIPERDTLLQPHHGLSEGDGHVCDLLDDRGQKRRLADTPGSGQEGSRPPLDDKNLRQSLNEGGILYEAFTLLFTLSGSFSSEELTSELHRDLGPSNLLGWECAAAVSNAARQVTLLCSSMGSPQLTRHARKLEQRAQFLM